MTSPPSVPQPSSSSSGGSADLDVLHFQDLVDDAKRLIPQVYPQWTDHNVSDPGITLIEACAGQIDQLSYRLDRMPPALRDALLRLLTPPPAGATPARTVVAFTRPPGSRGQAPVDLPAGTALAARGPDGEPIMFLTTMAARVPALGAFAYGRPKGKELDQNATFQLAAASPTTQAKAPAVGTYALVRVADPGPGKLLTVRLHLALAGAARAEGLWWQINTGGTGDSTVRAKWVDLPCLSGSVSAALQSAAEIVLRTPGPRGPSQGLVEVRFGVVGRPLSMTPDQAGQPGWQIQSLAPAAAVSPPVPAVQIDPGSRFLSLSPSTGPAAKDQIGPPPAPDLASTPFEGQDPGSETVPLFSGHIPAAGVYYLSVNPTGQTDPQEVECFGYDATSQLVPCTVLYDHSEGLTRPGVLAVQAGTEVNGPLQVSPALRDAVVGARHVPEGPIQAPTRTVSTGEPNQRLALASYPVLAEGHPLTVTVTAPDAPYPVRWDRVRSFATAGPEDPYYSLDVDGRHIVFGRRVHTADGVRQYGRIPPAGYLIEAWCDTTQGSRGNVPAHSITTIVASCQPGPDALLDLPGGNVHVFHSAGITRLSQHPPQPQELSQAWPALKKVAGLAPVHAAWSAPQALYLFTEGRCVRLDGATGQGSAAAQEFALPGVTVTGVLRHRQWVYVFTSAGVVGPPPPPPT